MFECAKFLDDCKYVIAGFSTVRTVVIRRGFFGMEQTQYWCLQPSSTCATHPTRHLAMHNRVRQSLHQSVRPRWLYFRIPTQAINQLADRSIQSYWATRPFNKNAIKPTDQTYRSEFVVLLTSCVKNGGLQSLFLIVSTGLAHTMPPFVNRW